MYNFNNQNDIPELLLSLNKAQSFTEKLFHTLNWTGNNPQRVTFSGVNWVSENMFSVNPNRLAQLYFVKPETITSSLRTNGFIKQYDGKGQGYFWMKDGFTIFGMQDQNTTNNNSNITQKKTGNEEFDDLLAKLFGASSELNREEFINNFYCKICPKYIRKDDLCSILQDFFKSEFVDFQQVWAFYQHFGPLNSLLAKYNNYKSCFNDITLSDKNKFIYKKKMIIFNKVKVEFGRPYLIDEFDHLYDSWEMVRNNIQNLKPFMYYNFPVSDDFILQNNTHIILD